MTNKELIKNVMRLQAILESRATYRTDCTDEEYNLLRDKVLKEPSIESKIPLFLETCRNLDQFWNYVKSPKFSKYDERRKFLHESFEPILAFLEKERKLPSDESTSTILHEINLNSVASIWRKAMGRITSDPDGAITLARTLLEDLCKHILDENNISYSKTENLSTLHSLASKEINIHPTQQDENTIKKLLGVCNSGVAGIGEFRNKFADSHGKGTSGTPPDPHYARFVVNLSGIISSLMVEKWMEKKDYSEILME